jgi:hemerythrin
MAFIKWLDHYNINIKEIDRQHQHLLQLINKIYEAVVAESEKSTLSRLLNELSDYSTYHFKTEEEMFSVHGYPGAEIHKQQHNYLSLQLLKLITDFEYDQLVISFDVLIFLNDWYVNHILVSDKKFSHFFNARGIF